MKTLKNICDEYMHNIEKNRTDFINELCEKIRKKTKDGILYLKYYDKNQNFIQLNYTDIALDECSFVPNEKINVGQSVRIYILAINAYTQNIYYTCNKQVKSIDENDVLCDSLLLFSADILYLLANFIHSNVEEQTKELTYYNQ